MDSIATYTADGWETKPVQLDYYRILDHARSQGNLPIASEDAAVAAAEQAYGWGGPSLWHGKTIVSKLGNWKWFAYDRR